MGAAEILAREKDFFFQGGGPPKMTQGGGLFLKKNQGMDREWGADVNLANRNNGSKWRYYPQSIWQIFQRGWRIHMSSLILDYLYKQFGIWMEVLQKSKITVGCLFELSKIGSISSLVLLCRPMKENNSLQRYF